MFTEAEFIELAQQAMKNGGNQSAFFKNIEASISGNLGASGALLDTAKAVMTHDDGDVRSIAHRTLEKVVKKWPVLADRRLVESVARAADAEAVSYVRPAAYNLLGTMVEARPDFLNEDITKQITQAAVEDENVDVREVAQWTATIILAKRPDLTDTVLNVLKKSMQDVRGLVRGATQLTLAGGLSRRPDLAETVLGLAKDALDDPEADVRFVTQKYALKNLVQARPDLVNKALTTRIMRIAAEDEDQPVRYAAYGLLTAIMTKRPDLADEDLAMQVAEGVVADTDTDVRSGSRRTLVAIMINRPEMADAVFDVLKSSEANDTPDHRAATQEALKAIVTHIPELKDAAEAPVRPSLSGALRSLRRLVR